MSQTLTFDLSPAIYVRVKDDYGNELHDEAIVIDLLAQKAVQPLPNDPLNPGQKLIQDADDWLVPFCDLLNNKYGTNFTRMQAAEIHGRVVAALNDLKKTSNPGSISPTPTETSASLTDSETTKEPCPTLS